MKQLLKRLRITGFFDIFSCSVINKIVSFLGNIILVRILTKNEYGIFTYAWNIYTIILLLNGLGLESGTLQLGSEHIHDSKITDALYNYVIRIGIWIELCLAIVILLIGGLVPMKLLGANYLLKQLCALPLLQFLYGIASVNLRARRMNTEYARLTTINTVLISLGSIMGAVFLREKGMILGYYVAYFISVCFSWHFCEIKLIKPKQSLASDIKKDLFSISLTSMANNGLSQLLYLLDVFVLGIVAANEEVLASYKVATTIPTALTFIPVTLMLYLYPYFAEHREDKKWCFEKYKKILPLMGCLNCAIAGILFLMAPYIIQQLFGNPYIDAIPIFRLLLINYVISGTFRILSGNLLITQRKLKFNLFEAVVSSSVNIIADFYLIRMWGSMGAAYATMLVVGVSSIMSTVYLVYTFTRE